MKTRWPKPSGPLLVVLLLALVAAILVALKPDVSDSLQVSSSEKASSYEQSPTFTVGSAAPDKPLELRPLPVGQASESHEWTMEDARLPEVIEKIAHNSDEFIRMVEENDRIQRRQLVYRRVPAWHAVEQAKGRGEVIGKLKLPALDGREVEMEVTSIDLSPSGLSGSFAGHLPGKLQSLVTLAFDRGREAFTVLSPEDGLYLQGHPREPGEVIVTSFDPAIYQRATLCDPIISSK